MMEQLAERRMRREEHAQFAGPPRLQAAQGHNHPPLDEDEEYDEDYDEEGDYSQDDVSDEDEDDMVNTVSLFEEAMLMVRRRR